MRRPITILIALSMMGGLVVPVHAGPIAGTLSADSTLTPAGPPGHYVQNLTGDGDDTRLGSFTTQSQSNIDFSNPPHITISNGTTTETFTNGTLLGTSSGSGTASGAGSATVTIDFVITGGTGFFAGAVGDVTISATITSTSSTTESITGSYVGSLVILPEPSSLALLTPALAVAAIAVVFRRRRRAMAHWSG
jgi:hypothetical protein